jgi:ketosteroid isomerase-like protein
MAEAARTTMSGFEGLHSEPDEYRELDDERVIVFVRFTGRGRTSGLELEQTRSEGAQLFQVRAGKVIRHVHYWDRAHAFAELGLTA